MVLAASARGAMHYTEVLNAASMGMVPHTWVAGDRSVRRHSQYIWVYLHLIGEWVDWLLYWTKTELHDGRACGVCKVRSDLSWRRYLRVLRSCDQPLLNCRSTPCSSSLWCESGGYGLRIYPQCDLSSLKALVFSVRNHSLWIKPSKSVF